MSTSLTLPNHMAPLQPVIPDIEAALSEHQLTPKAFARSLQSDIAANEKLFDCMTSDPASIMRCLVYAAELGLRPGTAHAHFHLIPRGGSCTHLVGYRGLMDLVARAGTSLNQPHLVWKGEDFHHDRATGEIRHPLNWDDDIDRSDTKNVLGAYISYRLKDSPVDRIYTLGRREIEERRKQSQNTSSNGPWAKHYASMAIKSVVRALCNSGLVPLGDMAGTLRKVEAEADDAEVVREAEFTEQQADQKQFDDLDNDPFPESALEKIREERQETEGEREAREEREAIQGEQTL